jgi:hypothetical protein
MLIPVVTALLFWLFEKSLHKRTKVKKKLPYEIRNLLKTYYDKTTFKIKDEKDRLPVKKYNEQQPPRKGAYLLSHQNKELPYKRGTSG